MGREGFLKAEQRFVCTAEELRRLVRSYECEPMPRFVQWDDGSDAPDSWMLDHVEGLLRRAILLVLKGLSVLGQVEGLNTFISHFGHMMREFGAWLLSQSSSFCPVETYNLEHEEAQKVASQAWLQRVLSAFKNERASTVCNPFKSKRLWVRFVDRTTNVQAAYLLGVHGIELVACIVRAVEFKSGECDNGGISLYCFLQNILTLSLHHLLIEDGGDELLVSVHKDPLRVVETVDSSNSDQKGFHSHKSPGLFPFGRPLLQAMIDTAGKLLSLPNLSVVSDALNECSAEPTLASAMKMTVFQLANICQLFFQPLSVPFGFEETDLACFPSINQAVNFVISSDSMATGTRRYWLYLLSASFLVSSEEDCAKFREAITPEMTRSLAMNSSFLLDSYQKVKREHVPILEFLLSLLLDNDSIEMNEIGKRIQIQFRQLLVEIKDDYRTLIALLHKNPIKVFDTLFHPNYPSHPEFEVLLCFWLRDNLRDVNMDELWNAKQLKDSVEYLFAHEDRAHGFMMIANTLFDHQSPSPYSISLEYDKLRSALICSFYNYSLLTLNNSVFDTAWCDRFCTTLLQNAMLEGSWLDEASYTCAYFQDFLLAIPNRFISKAFSESCFQDRLLSFARRLIQKEITKHSGREKLDICCSKLRILAMICHVRKDTCYKLNALKSAVLKKLTELSSVKPQKMETPPNRHPMISQTMVIVALLDFCSCLINATSRLFTFGEFKQLEKCYERVFYERSNFLRRQIPATSFAVLFVYMQKSWSQSSDTTEANELAISIFNTFIDALVEERVINSEATIICQGLTVLFECKYKSSDTWLKMYRDPTFTRLCMRTTSDILRSMDTFTVKRISIVHLYLRLVCTVQEIDQFAKSLGGKEKLFDERAARIMFNIVMESEDSIMGLGIMNHMAFVADKMMKRRIFTAASGKSFHVHPVRDMIDLWTPRVTEIWRTYHGPDGRLPLRLNSVWRNPHLRTLVPKEWLLSAIAERERTK